MSSRQLFWVLLLSTSAVVRADEYDTLRQKWSDMLTGGGNLILNDPEIASRVASITNAANTQWNSLNKSAARTALWSDAASTTDSAHISTNFSRLRAMALAYATTGSALRGNPALRDDILAGLDWMIANRYNETKRYYDNWWDWEIGSPKLLVDAATLMHGDLSDAQLASYMRAVEKFTPSATTPAAGGSTGTFTGANRMDKIYVVAIRGLLVKDDAKLRAARDAFSNLFLYVTSGDGFYVDGSFIQHNRHPYTGSYGAALMSAIAPILALLNGPNADSSAGSSWRVTDPNLANIFRWIYEAYEPVIYRGGMMAMLQGRAISRSGTSEHGLGHSLMLNFLRLSELAPESDRAHIRALLRGWAESDTARSFVASAALPQIEQVQQLLADPSVTPRGELRANIMFGSMDRMVHLGPGFAAGLAMSSSRIYTYESINTENLRGWYTGDGLLYLYNNDLAHFSDSYWPTVDPRRLPGTTVDATQARTNASGQSTLPTYNWVGGVSLGRHGAAGMQLDGWNNTLTAKKSWFMFEHEIACLGSGISSTNNRPIETTIENRLLNNTTGNGAFTVDGSAQPTTLGWSATLEGTRWAHLAGRTSGSDIGYFFPDGATVKALRETRTGAWSDINGGGSTTAIRRNYLTLWLEHGANPANASYAYYLLPNRSAAEVADFAASPAIAVLENTPAIQAVRHTTLGLVAANFWNDGRASVGGLTVDRKASVIAQNDGNGNLEVAVADPTQANTGAIEVELDTAATAIMQADTGITVSQLAPTLRLTVNVATARGRSFRARFATGQTKTRGILTNLSTRAYLAPGDNPIIAGFVVGGTGTKRLLVRAIGPSLAAFGLTGALANPRLAIVNRSGATVGENDDWGSAPNAAELATIFPVAGAFPLDARSRDAAALVTLPPGQYSAIVRSADGTGGVALIELYDLTPGGPARLVNLSTRTFSGTGEQTAIVGFGLSGAPGQPVLIRAAGPALADFGVAGALADPQLRVVNSAGTTLAQNDNWGASVFTPEITAAATAVAAFALAPTSRDAAVIPILPPGTYTAIAAGAGNTTGQTLVEVYVVP